MDYTQFSQTLPTFARPFLERQGHWFGLFRTSQLVLPFPPEKGYLPQRVLSQIDCSEHQPLIEGGLAQGSEIKVLSSKRRDNQSCLKVCFFMFHKAAVWQHLKCAKINSSKIRSNYFKISVTSDHCIAPYYKENTYVSSSPPVVGRLLRRGHPSRYSSPWVTEWVVCYYWIPLVVVFESTCSNHPLGWRYQTCSRERRAAGYCNPANLQVETNSLNSAKNQVQVKTKYCNLAKY